VVSVPTFSSVFYSSFSMYPLNPVPNGRDLFTTNEELLQDAFSVE